MAKYVIGIDIGTQSTKSAIFDTDGNLAGEASQPTALHTPKPDWVEQDAEELYQSAVQTVRRAVNDSGLDPKDVRAISLDGQIPSMVRIDENWQPQGPVESYLDTRPKAQRDAMMSKYGNLILDSNGIYPYFAQKLVWWKQEHPHDYERIYKALTVNTYVGGRLCGLKGDEAYVDPTHMGIYGWADIRTFGWSEDLAAKLGIDMDKSPRPVLPTDIVGALTPDAAQEAGLIPGIPIAAGLGDAIAGWLGIGAVEPGIMVDTSGTANHVGICADHYEPDLDNGVLTYYPSAIPGQWFPVGYTAGTGRSHSWFIDALCLDETNANDQSGELYSMLEEAARQVPPGSEGLIFSPHFGSRVCPDQPSIRGFWLGLTWKHTKAHLYRSVLESIAFEYYVYLKVASQLFPDVEQKRMIVVGGGAKSPLWTQIKADILNVPHATCENRSDFAPLGSAVVAGHAVGLFPDMAETVKQFTEISQDVLPRPAYTEAYRPYAEFYTGLYGRIEPIFDDLASLAAQPSPPHEP
jgi:xylulokinase